MRTFLVITLIAAASAAGWNTYQAPPTYKAPGKPAAPQVDFTTAEDVVETIFPADKNDSCPEGTAQYSKPTTVNGIMTSTIVCIPCAANGCMDCNGNTNTDPLSYLTCNACDTGFGLNGKNQCQRCSDVPNCNICGPDPTLSGDPFPTDFICQTCKDGYFLIPSAGGTEFLDVCTACNDPTHGIYQCAVCQPETDLVADPGTTLVSCTTCATGYATPAGNTAPVTFCDSCADGYVDNHTGVAFGVTQENPLSIPVPVNCVTCASVFPTGHCKTCSSSVSGGVVSYQCVTCPDGTTATTCPGPKPPKPTKPTKPVYNNYNNKYRGW